MEKRIRLILIALAILSLVSLYVSFKLYRDKQSLSQQYTQMEQSLKQENDALLNKYTAAQEAKRKFQEDIDGLNKDFDKISREREELKRMYTSVLEEKNEMSGKLKEAEQHKGVATGVTVAPLEQDTYWASILKTKADLEIRLNDAKGKLREISIKADELSKDKSNLELELSKFKQSNEDLERRFSYTEKLSETLSLDLVREKNDKRTLQAYLKTIKEENVAISDQLKDLRNLKVALEKKLDKSLSEKTQLEQRMGEMEETLKDRLSDIAEIKKDMQVVGAPEEVALTQEEAEQPQEDIVGSKAKKSQAIELPPIVVRPEGGTAKTATTAAVSLAGKIIAVNKENNFVIIDLGEDTGIKPGRKFGVYREDQKIATIEIIQTRKNISAADIKQTIKQINVGDIVK